MTNQITGLLILTAGAALMVVSTQPGPSFVGAIIAIIGAVNAARDSNN